MLNRNQIAHEYAIQLIKKEGYVSVSSTVFTAFELAEAMLDEAEKRTDKERPEVLNDWVSVKDRLPEHLEPVTAYSVKGGVFHAWTVDGSRWRNHLYYIDNVTHWQPLPSPPKGALK